MAFLDGNGVARLWKNTVDYVDSKGIQDLGVDPDFDFTFDTLIEEGKYRVSDGDFIYTITVERPDELFITQKYWSTEEGVEYSRFGYYDEGEEGFFFNEWASYLTDEVARFTYAVKDHVHYSMLSTSNFFSWISAYRGGEYYVNDTNAGKYYFVKQYDPGSVVGEKIRRYQEYFEISEPDKKYSRAGSANVGNSSNITWEEWKVVGEDEAISLTIIDEICADSGL